MSDIRLLKKKEKRLDILKLMNIESLEDLINHYPYRYDVIEETYPTQEDDKIIIEGTLISPVKIFFRGRMSRMSFSVEDRYQNVYQVTIFNRHFLRQYLKQMTICLNCAVQT